MIVAANFKTNLTRIETGEYLGELESLVGKLEENVEVRVFPATSSLVVHRGEVVLGAQNAYPTKSGAFTGEIGLVHLEEFDIKSILIGHSERRHILHETQVDVVKKFDFFKEQEFEIIYCIGEPLRVKEQGIEATLEYLRSQFEGIDTDYAKLIVAYEPVWAIGSGLTPTLEEIENVHKALKTETGASLLYGGSVKVNNARAIMELPSVDGVLVGSGALKVEDFFAMIQVAREIELKNKN